MLPLFAATLSIISLFKKLVKHFLFFIFFNYFYVLSFFHVFFVFLLIFILPTKKEPDHSDSFSHTFYFTVPSKLHTNFSSQTYYHFLPWPFWSSPRPISSSQLHALRHFHPCPINLVVFKGSYFFRMGYLRGAVLSTRGPGWTDLWCTGWRSTPWPGSHVGTG